MPARGERAGLLGDEHLRQVGGGDDARFEGRCIGGPALGEAASVPALVVAGDGGDGLFGQVEHADGLGAEHGVLVDGLDDGGAVGEADVGALGIGHAQGEGAEDGVLIDAGDAAEVGRREGDADVVQEGAVVHAGARGGFEAHGVGEHGGDVADAVGVAERLPFREVEGEAEADGELARGERVEALGTAREWARQVVEREDRPALGRVV